MFRTPDEQENETLENIYESYLDEEEEEEEESMDERIHVTTNSISQRIVRLRIGDRGEYVNVNIERLLEENRQLTKSTEALAEQNQSLIDRVERLEREIQARKGCSLSARDMPTRNTPSLAENAKCQSPQRQTLKQQIRGAEIPQNEVSVGAQIGSGTYCCVYSGLLHGTEVAIKKFPMNDEDSVKAFSKELQVLEQIKHPNLVIGMGAFITKSFAHIVTELVTHGNLAQVL